MGEPGIHVGSFAGFDGAAIFVWDQTEELDPAVSKLFTEPADPLLTPVNPRLGLLVGHSS